MTNGQVESCNKRTRSKVNLSHDRLNATYYAFPHTNSRFFESKSDKGTAMAAKWETNSS